MAFKDSVPEIFWVTTWNVEQQHVRAQINKLRGLIANNRHRRINLPQQHPAVPTETLDLILFIMYPLVI